MSFDEKRKRTREELVHALRACATMGAECEQCEFYEADTPRGYSPCHEALMLKQAADYIEEQTAKVENIEDPAGMGAYGDCSECGAEVNEQYAYYPNCGARLEWDE